MSVGSVLEHRTSGELRYYPSSSNNARLFERVMLVSSEADMNRLFANVLRVDLCEVAAEQHQTTSWKVRFVTSITFYLDKLLGAGLIGDGRVSLPDYIRNNRYVVRMDRNNGRVFEDNRCFFRCLAMQLDCLCDLGDTGEVDKRQRRCVCKVQGVKNARVLRLYEPFRLEF